MPKLPFSTFLLYQLKFNSSTVDLRAHDAAFGHRVGGVEAQVVGLRGLAPQVVDERELDEGGEDESRAHAHPHIDSLKRRVKVFRSLYKLKAPFKCLPRLLLTLTYDVCGTEVPVGRERKSREIEVLSTAEIPALMRRPPSLECKSALYASPFLLPP